MANLTITAGGPASPPTGVTNDQWSATVDGNTLKGVRSYPTTAGLHRYIFFLRGGFTGANTQLDDTMINNHLENWPLFATSLQGESTTGNYVFSPGIRGSDSPWTSGGAASGGTDEMGGADIEDVRQAWTLGMEFTGSGLPRVDPCSSALIGFSSGALRGLMAMRGGKLRPRCAIFRAPLVNIYDWDNVSDTNKALIEAMIPGWSSTTLTKASGLTKADRRALYDRSPMQWADELPDIPYLIIQAETDTTAPRSWTEGFAEALTKAGRRVEVHTVTGAGHAFTGSEDINLSNLAIRRFLAVNQAAVPYYSDLA